MDDLTPQLANLGAQLAASAARNTASTVADKIAAIRASRSAGDQVAALEEMVSDLITDKNELTRIAQAYQQELVAQQLTPGDVRYITDTVVPLLEQFADGMENQAQGAQLKQQIQTLKPLLSVETVTILQLLGFNFRQGIGAPLTQRLKTLIDGTEILAGHGLVLTPYAIHRDRRQLRRLDPGCWGFAALLGVGVAVLARAV